MTDDDKHTKIIKINSADVLKEAVSLYEMLYNKGYDYHETYLILRQSSEFVKEFMESRGERLVEEVSREKLGR